MADEATNTQGMSLADFAAAIRARDPRLASVPDSVLVRKVLERRPEMLNFLQRSEQRPAIGSLYERIGGRLKQNLNIPQQAQSAAEAISAGLKNIREHGPSQMPAFLAALEQYKKRPENVIGDALTTLIMGQAGGGPERAGAPKSGEAPASARMPATTESFEDMMTRRGPGEPPNTALNQQRTLVDNLRMRYERQKASGDPGMWATAAKLRDVEDALKQAEKAQWGPAYSKSTTTLSKEGGGGANYSAEDLAALKKKWGIQ